MLTDTQTDAFATFLGILGAIEAAAVRGYGQPGIILDVYPAEAFPRQQPDQSPDLRIRLIGQWPEGTPKETARQKHSWEYHFPCHDLMMHGMALEVVLTEVEHGARKLAQAEGR
jgi:hypothetical protein